MPTLLDAAKVAMPKGRKLDGTSLLPTLLGRESLRKRQLVWNGKAIRDGHWKLIVNGKGSKGTALFNLSMDLGEKKNLAKSEPERVQKMLAALETWKTDVAKGATPQPSAVKTK